MPVDDDDVFSQEIDCIVNHMMTVAEYLGWDVSELKPVSERFVWSGILETVNPLCTDST